ncbi:uncharacterized protein MYCFIDRAFT_178282 [Pseudocercospora fijiensis CIRAD86]|uniref:Uncharacterized protein n=1 Tax=Pseudocercospora fijiensis (strain CIRAD86) TaxID=383855 RepID=M2ZKY2_PSEFD|nr:uncharacterized protein MYCFIDRAFT_178282 [Pseudocercospora fijiensis CIRAD86]EME79714.1 hypothetical protein MYCFIDRAFT_178282 [Pseudocercospora fijiensis CIRAD86]
MLIASQVCFVLRELLLSDISSCSYVLIRRVKFGGLALSMRWIVAMALLVGGEGGAGELDGGGERTRAVDVMWELMKLQLPEVSSVSEFGKRKLAKQEPPTSPTKNASHILVVRHFPPQLQLPLPASATPHRSSVSASSFCFSDRSSARPACASRAKNAQTIRCRQNAVQRTTHPAPISSESTLPANVHVNAASTAANDQIEARTCRTRLLNEHVENRYPPLLHLDVRCSPRDPIECPCKHRLEEGIIPDHDRAHHGGRNNEQQSQLYRGLAKTLVQVVVNFCMLEAPDELDVALVNVPVRMEDVDGAGKCVRENAMLVTNAIHAHFDSDLDVKPSINMHGSFIHSHLGNEELLPRRFNPKSLTLPSVLGLDVSTAGIKGYEIETFGLPPNSSPSQIVSCQGTVAELEDATAGMEHMGNFVFMHMQRPSLKRGFLASPPCSLVGRTYSTHSLGGRYREIVEDVVQHSLMMAVVIRRTYVVQQGAVRIVSAEGPQRSVANILHVSHGI